MGSLEYSIEREAPRPAATPPVASRPPARPHPFLQWRRAGSFLSLLAHTYALIYGLISLSATRRAPGPLGNGCGALPYI